jgi:hypothetical protein
LIVVCDEGGVVLCVVYLLDGDWSLQRVLKARVFSDLLFVLTRRRWGSRYIMLVVSRILLLPASAGKCLKLAVKKTTCYGRPYMSSIATFADVFHHAAFIVYSSHPSGI